MGSEREMATYVIDPCNMMLKNFKHLCLFFFLLKEYVFFQSMPNVFLPILVSLEKCMLWIRFLIRNNSVMAFIFNRDIT